MFRLLMALSSTIVITFCLTSNAAIQDEIVILALDWSPDGAFLALGQTNGAITIWSYSSGLMTTSLEGHTQEVTALAWEPNHYRLASASADGSVRVWHPATSTLLIDIQIVPDDAPNRPILAVAWNSTGEYIAAARDSGEVTIWKVHTAEQVGRYNHASIALTVAWHPSSNLLVSGGLDGKLMLWNLSEQTVVDVTPSPDGHGAIYALAWSPDGNQLALGSTLQGVEVFDRHLQTRIFYMGNDNHATIRLAWSPNGTFLAVVYSGLTAIVEAVSGNIIEHVHYGEVFAPFAWSPYDGQLAIRSESIHAADLFGRVQFIVPDPSLDRLNAIAELCTRDSANPALAAPLVAQSVTEATLPAFVVQIESLPADAIPPACRADLLAVAEALRSQP